MVEKKTTTFEAAGQKTLQRIIDTFYGLVAKDPDLALIFPNDLSEVARKKKQFTTQYLGGPALYTKEHGHPIMRASHSPFPITPTGANAWFSCMSHALDKVDSEGPVREDFYSLLVITAQYMINTLFSEEKLLGEYS